MIKSFQGDVSIGSDVNTVYYDATKFLEQALKNLRKDDPEIRIVVFVDDLDRCTPEKALEVLESIKSFLDIEGIVYVIGMNYNSIDALIKVKYGENPNITGFNYMEKIVQLPFRVPTWQEEDMSKFLDGIIENELADSAFKNELIINKEILIKAVQKNPREVKRFLNDLILARATFDKPMDKLIVVQALKFRHEWNNFLEFLMEEGDEWERNAFVHEIEKFSSQGYEHMSEQLKNKVLKAHPSFFKEDDSLRLFLDSGALSTLVSIRNISEYRTALESISLKTDINGGRG